ncbi:MAG: hypothetical protein DRQ47_00125 [Gammaproteobacteria bacterium]|nr:MAG: hypothetical protein DRQ47_00125 [Gammaproteobacteria bacterium]
MFEYVLFHEKPFNLFISWLKEKEVEHQVEMVDENYEIRVPEDIDDDLLDELEERYDELMDMTRDISNDEEKANNEGYHMAGVSVTLKDGSVSYADIDPEVMGRVISVVSAKEFAQIVEAIANAVENPQSNTYCQRMRGDC